MAKFLKKPAFLKIPTFKIPKLTKKRSQSVGLPPGTPVYIGEERAEPVRISCMNFSKDKFDERQDVTVNECKTLANTPEVTWINVDGIYDTQIISSIGDA
ncbi:MAG: hypothetical protein Q7J68_00895, partial [Thermoplasmata archaeon]|nr:hypothetical protein [Thermoplasmata archaeon]